MKISDILYYALQGFKLAGKNEVYFYKEVFVWFMLMCATFYFIDLENAYIVLILSVPYVIGFILDIYWYAINDTVDRYTLKPHAVSDKLKKNISWARDKIEYVQFVALITFLVYMHNVRDTLF